MMTVVWLLTAATWVAHVGLLFESDLSLFDLLRGRVPPAVALLLVGALLPQLFLVPWAWRDVGRTEARRAARRLWRVCFFLTGFVAITVYALKYKTRVAPHV